MKLRDYQTEAVKAIREGWRSCPAGLVALPTGTGKTIIGLELFRQEHKRGKTRSIWMAHRDELIRQPLQRLLDVWPESIQEGKVGIVKAEENGADASVILASVQTLVRPNRLAQVLEHGPIDFLVTDEAHHSTAPTYVSVYHELLKANPNLKHVGFTATPTRGDRDPLLKVFSEIFYQKSIVWMIRKGYLCSIKGVQIRTELDLSEVQTQAGDYNSKELAAALDTHNWDELVAEAILEHASNRRGIIFTLLIAQAEAVAERLAEAGFTAIHVDGKMPIEHRRARLKAFRKGQIQFLANAMVLTEGYDGPFVDMIAMARPTKSQTLYIQCVGRGSRLWPGKKDCLVIDFTDAHHSIIQLPDLGEPAEAKELKEKLDRLQIDGLSEPVMIFDPDKLDGRGVYAEAIDLLWGSGLHWYMSGQEMSVGLGDEGTLLILPNEEEFALYLATKTRGVLKLRRSPDPSFLVEIANEYALEFGSKVLTQHGKPWMKKDPSWKQEELLKKWGLPIPLTKGEASKMISHQIAKWSVEKRRARQ